MSNKQMMLNKKPMLNKLSEMMHPWLIKALGRDRLEYLASNTTNEVTRRIDSFIWSYDCKAKIVAIRQETPDTKTFVLLPNQHFKQPLAGQHIEVTLKGDSFQETVSRCYTLSEISTDTVSITVKHNPEGQVSDWLHKHAEVGVVFDISSPRGRFVYREQDKLLFICAGSGITPAFSMINNLLENPQKVDLALFYRTQTPENTIFSEQLSGLTSKVKLDLSYSRLSTENAASLVDQLMEVYPDIKQQHIYLCGPESFRNEVIKYLESIDYDMSRLEIEQFTLPANNIQQGRKLDEDISVTLKSRNINFVIPAKDANKTILEAAEKQGVEMEHGCRSGMCGSCKINLVSGEVSGNQIGKSIYPCSSYPASNQLVLE